MTMSPNTACSTFEFRISEKTDFVDEGIEYMVVHELIHCKMRMIEEGYENSRGGPDSTMTLVPLIEKFVTDMAGAILR